MRRLFVALLLGSALTVLAAGAALAETTWDVLAIFAGA